VETLKVVGILIGIATVAASVYVYGVQ